MKLIPTVHPAYVMRGNWPLLSLLRRDLEKATRESWSARKRERKIEYKAYPSTMDAREVLKVGDKRPLYLDIETERLSGRIICCGLAREPGKIVCIPWRRPFIDMLRPVVADATCAKVAHNAPFDFPRVSAALGVGVVGRWIDTLVAHALVEPDLEHGLDDVGSVYFDGHPWKGDKGDTLEIYCCKDVDATACSWQELERELVGLGLEKLFRERVMPAMPVLMAMQERGVGVDLARMARLAAKIDEESAEIMGKINGEVEFVVKRRKRIDQLLQQADETEKLVEGASKKEIRSAATAARRLRAAAEKLGTVNVLSPKQLAELLYEDLGLERKYSESGRLTTDDGALVELARTTRNPILEQVRRLRELLKLRGTYLSYEDDVLHPEFVLTGTVSGRLSSRNPNMQNIPSRGPRAKEVRAIFVPVERGNLFTKADYSQIEIRLQAWFARDFELMRAFDEGVDVHQLRAAKIYGKRPEDVTEQERYLAKRVVYGDSYGMGYLKLARVLAEEGVYITPVESKALLAGLSAAEPKRTAWKEGILAAVERDRKLVNPFGRLRWFLGPAFGDALNFLPQSTAADVILGAKVRLTQQLPKGAYLVVQVHDELLVEHPPEMTSIVKECLRDIMEAPVAEMGGWRCPVDMKTGRNWAMEAA